MIGVVERMSEAIARLSIGISAITVVIMCLHVAAGIITRALFSSTLNGTVEIVSHFYMVIVAFVPWAYIQHRGEHVSVDILLNVLPDWGNIVTRTIANVITLIVQIFFAWALFDMALRQTKIGELVEAGTIIISVWPARWIAGFGVAAMICVLVAQILRPSKDPAATIGDDDNLPSFGKDAP